MKSEGALGLYRGIGAMGLGAGPAHAVYFSMYDVCKEKLGGNRHGHHPFAHVASGVVATIASDAVFTPMDVVKQRLQLRSSPYGGVMDCIKRMLREEGFGPFYASYRTTVVMNAPFTTVHFATYEAVKKVLTKFSPENASEEHLLAHITACGAVGALASVMTTPLDVIKTRLQCQVGYLSCPGLQHSKLSFANWLGVIACETSCIMQAIGFNKSIFDPINFYCKGYLNSNSRAQEIAISFLIKSLSKGSVKKRIRAILAKNSGKSPIEAFPSLLITAEDISSQGSFAEAQAKYLSPDASKVAELVDALKEKQIGVVAHFYMDLEVQGVLVAAKQEWPHIHISDSLVMADRALKMAEDGCKMIAVLGVDFMSENVRAILDRAGFEKVTSNSLMECLKRRVTHGLQYSQNKCIFSSQIMMTPIQLAGEERGNNRGRVNNTADRVRALTGSQARWRTNPLALIPGRGTTDRPWQEALSTIRSTTMPKQ
uniref:Uncharacterized protein n=1 Tax=Taxus chinensis TaxID=29808 RepID=A0AA38L197_TAXCH|nr:hypothetical protein KI387_035928 [Taxus chinensis]